MVTVALAFIGIIIGALLSAASYAYKLKLQNLNAKDNFYYVEQAMQEIYAGVGANTIEEMKEAYAYTLENMVRYDVDKGMYITISDEEANKMFKERFMNNIMTNPYFSQGSDVLAESLQSYITNGTVDLDNGKVSVKAVYEDDANGQPVLKQIVIKDVTLTRIQSYNKSVANGTFIQTISTDIVISEPDFNVSFNAMASDYSKIFDYALVGDMGIEIVATNLTPRDADGNILQANTSTAVNSVTGQLNISGNLYAGADYYNKTYNTMTSTTVSNSEYSYKFAPVSSKSNDVSQVTSPNGLVNLYALDENNKYYTFDGENERSMNSGLYVSGRTVSLMTDTIIVPGTIAVMDSADLTIFGSAGVSPEVWTDNIVLGGSSTADTDGNYTGAELYVSGDLFVRDDTEINARGASFTLLGAYYGYGNSTSKDSRVFVPTVDTTNFAITTVVNQGGTEVTTTENRGHYNSSSIVINAEGSTLDLSQADSLYLAGRAYIELSKKTDSSASTENVYKETYVYQPTYTVDEKTNYIRDYKTGESISVKSNQLMYNVSSLGATTTIKVGNTEYPAIKVNTKYTEPAEVALGNKGFFARFFPIEIFGNNVIAIKEQVNGKTVYYIDLATGFKVLNEVIANEDGLYTEGQVEAAVRTLSVTGTTESDYVQFYVAYYEYNLKENPKTELVDIIDFDEFEQGVLDIDALTTDIYSSGAITTRKDSEFTLITGNNSSIPNNLLSDSAYATYDANYTYATGDNSINAIEDAFDMSKDYELEYNYMKWNLGHYEGGNTEKAFVKTILSMNTLGEDTITPINKYLVMSNIDPDDDMIGKETLSGYKVWISDEDVIITGDDVINGIVITKGNVTFADDVEEFNGMVVSGSKIYIGDKLTKLSASPIICRGVIRDCITAGDSDAEYILKLFKEYENYTATNPGGAGGAGGAAGSTSVNIDAIDYTDVVSMTNWMKNVGGDYDEE